MKANHPPRKRAHKARTQNETILRDIKEVSLGALGSGAPLPPDGTSGSDEYSTGRWLARLLCVIFGLDFDPATSEKNQNNWLFRGFYALSRGQNGLVLPWDGRIFVNPPYSQLQEWTDKAIQEVLASRAKIVVMILPSSLATTWFYENVFLCPFCQWFPLRNRVAFGGRSGSGDFATIIAVWRHPSEPPLVNERAMSMGIGEARANMMEKKAADRRLDSLVKRLAKKARK